MKEIEGTGQSKDIQSTKVDGDDINLDEINIFSTRKPKDAAAGLSSGLKNLGKGVLGGAAALLYAPCK